MRKLLFISALLIGTSILAQHPNHQHHKDTTKSAKPKPAPKPKSDKQHHEHHSDSMNAPMSHSFSLNLPMTRNGSGTSWLPDSSVMYGHGIMTANWMFMFHYNQFIRYNAQDITNKGTRGDSKFDAPNMMMFMGQRRIGSRGLFRFSTMVSTDPFTVGAEGYPLLFQTGETYLGQPLVDRQHPHDLISELSVGYTHAFSRHVDLSAYFGFPGEPAIGPVAFMHRNSAINNPDAPLGHHWQDATHITMGVATIGLRVGMVKLEGSLFTGREPDENRYDIDPAKFDSYAARMLINPNAEWALQVSHAFIKSPEALSPEENVKRTTASVMHNRPLGGENRYVASSFVWGYNNGHDKTHTLLTEVNIQLDRLAIYSRHEFVQKSSRELNLNEMAHDKIFNINAFTLGANYTVLRMYGNNLALGAQMTAFNAPDLDNIYGNRPLAAEVYIRLSPHVMHMHHHGH